MSALAKGKSLVEASLRWLQPVAGMPPGQASDTDQARGVQWRLVMGYGGFETMARALLVLGFEDRLNSWYFLPLLRPIRLPMLSSIIPPSGQKSELQKWLHPHPEQAAATPWTGHADHPLIVFLNLERNDAIVMQHWLVDGEPITTWPDAIQLARALRNTTVSGALSASKVIQFGLEPTFEVLTLHLGRIATAMLHQLANKTELEP